MKEDNSKKIILDLCGGTGSWSKPYKDAGYTVISYTLPDYDVLYWERDGDFVNLLPNVYGILAAPPCTQFSIARNDKTALKPRDFKNGMGTVKACLNIVWETLCYQQDVWGTTNIKLKFWALENPNTGYLPRFLGKPALVFNPCDYGDPYEKRTALWGDFNLNLKKNPVTPLKLGKSFIHETAKMKHLKIGLLPEGYQKKLGVDTRTILRSITPQGFAEAFYKANK